MRVHDDVSMSVKRGFGHIWLTKTLYTFFHTSVVCRELTCTRWWGSFAPLPRSEPTPFSRHLPWPSLPANGRTPSRRRQSLWNQRAPPCWTPALFIHSQMMRQERGSSPEASEPEAVYFTFWLRQKKRNIKHSPLDKYSKWPLSLSFSLRLLFSFIVTSRYALAVNGTNDHQKSKPFID